MREGRGHLQAPADPRRRGELLRPAGVRQRTGEVGHRQQRESEIRLQLCHAPGFGPALPDRVLEKIDRRRKALAECDLGDQAMRPRPYRRISRGGEDVLGEDGRSDDVAGALVMLGAPESSRELELEVIGRCPRCSPFFELGSELRRTLSTGSLRRFVKAQGQPAITIAGCELGVQRLLIRVGDPLREPAMHVGAASRRGRRIDRAGKERVGKPDSVVGVDRHETSGDGGFEMARVHELCGWARQRSTLKQRVPRLLGQLLDATQDESRHGLRDRTTEVGRLVPVPCRRPGNLESNDRVATRKRLDAGELVPRKRVSEPLVDQSIEVRP